MAGYPSSQALVTDQVINAYVAALEGLPLEAVRRACGAYSRGEIEGHNHAFPPSAAELTRASLRFVPKPVLAALPEPAEKQLSEEDRKRMAQKFSELAANVGRRYSQTEIDAAMERAN